MSDIEWQTMRFVDGEWCAREDAEKLLAENADLQQALNDARTQLESAVILANEIDDDLHKANAHISTLARMVAECERMLRIVLTQATEDRLETETIAVAQAMLNGRYPATESNQLRDAKEMVEPVAYRYRDNNSDDWMFKPYRPDWLCNSSEFTVDPLYLHPPTPEKSSMWSVVRNCRTSQRRRPNEKAD